MSHITGPVLMDAIKRGILAYHNDREPGASLSEHVYVQVAVLLRDEFAITDETTPMRVPF